MWSSFDHGSRDVSTPEVIATGSVRTASRAMIAKMAEPPDDMALEMGKSVVQLARWLIDRRDHPETTDAQPRLIGYRMRTKNGRIVSSTRAMERVVFSKECSDLLDSGVEFDDLVPWLNQQILDDMYAAAEASFLDIDGLTTATQVHEWVDAQQPEVES